MKNEKSKKILIIEDEKALINVMGMKLKNVGFEVFSCLTGQEGLATAAKEKPDIILLDIIMPEMDGYAVLENLQSNPDTKDIPVVIVSNSGRDEEIAKGRQLGAVDYLVKSQLSLEEMTNKVIQILTNGAAD